MNKTTKIILIIIAIPLVIIIAAGIGLKLYFTSERLKALVIPKIEEQIQRDVGIDHMSLKIFPRISLEIDQLTISNPAGLAFAKDEFLSLEQLVLDVDLKPLLRKELQINEITLQRPRIYLEVNSDGKANYEIAEAEVDIEVETEPEAAEEAPGAASAFAFSLSDLNIVDAELEYLDVKGDQRAKIRGYNQHLAVKVTDGGDHVYLTSEASAQGISYGSVKSYLITDLPLESYQRLSYHAPDDRLSIDSIQVGIKAIGLVLQGEVTQMQTAPLLDLRLKSTSAEIEQLLSLVPAEYLKDAEGVTSSGNFQFAMTVKGQAGADRQPAVEGTFLIENGQLSYPDLPKSITNINVRGSFSQPASSGGKSQAGRLTVDRFSASLGTSNLKGNLAVVDFDDPAISATFNGSVNLGEVKEYYPLESDMTLAGTLTGNLSLNGKAADPAKIKASGSIEFKNVSAYSPTMARPVQNLNGTITFNNQLIEAKNFIMQIGQSDLSLDFSLRNYLAFVMDEAAKKGKPFATLTLKSKLLRTADLVTESETGAEAEGGEVAVAGAGGFLIPDISADVTASIGKMEMEKFSFTSVKGKVKLRDRVLELTNFSLNAFEGSVKTSGKLDFRSLEQIPFDLKLDINQVQANAMLPHFTTFGQQVHGAFTLSGALKGALNDTLGIKPDDLNGRGSIEITEGRLEGYPLTVKLADFTGIEELRELRFKRWAGNVKIENGRIIFSETKIRTKDNQFYLSGSQGFDGTMDYNLRVKIPEKQLSSININGVAGDVLKYLKDDQGWVNLRFKVTGTTQNPRLTLDQKTIEDAAKKVLEEKAREELDKLEDDVKDQLEDALKDLFGK